ncbi:PQQ-dependent sugar dehydrogenase [Gracilibacillus sp. S3-1-1]|uniref:PQQ-dependent sugar dehydrogenase n=1 Tax=Gracilibacillus pellucidus TaxID=3095368 RepID=A0ACC6M4K8_9BACI|nr:PQQ-dependent sugar dehydrogenase [Gracilibacillus sp. S3-1-1]MDX8045833.1 PQQ-dependent sugar dehydrogenase [Gracilibacillus sp. S3-1-1]
MRCKVGSMLIFVCFFVIACSTDDDTGSLNQTEEQTEADSVEVIAENLDIPWAIEKVGDTFFITERPGTIVKIENGQVNRQYVELERELADSAEAGLLGFALAPHFAETNEAYGYYTYVDDEGQFNRIVTLQLNGDTWIEEDVLVDRIPSGTYHHGGRLKIGPDNKLYATTGDASEPDLAQNMESLGGNILRLNIDGSIPEDNPFEDSYVYSYGHRNPQGLAWTDVGTLYASEHGSNANDEINQIEAGNNYGWPVIEGNEQQEGLVTPIFTSGADTTWAPSGMAYHDGKLYVAALRGTAVLAFDLETEGYEEVVSDIGRVRDVWIEQDNLYVVTNNTDGRGTPGEADDILYKVSLEK